MFPALSFYPPKRVLLDTRTGSSMKSSFHIFSPLSRFRESLQLRGESFCFPDEPLETR